MKVTLKVLGNVLSTFRGSHNVRKLYLFSCRLSTSLVLQVVCAGEKKKTENKHEKKRVLCSRAKSGMSQQNVLAENNKIGKAVKREIGCQPQYEKQVFAA